VKIRVGLDQRIIVIGGGIGGLAAAIGLHRAGLHPVVFERAAQLREVGAGLSLWPNALKALEDLGSAAGIRGLSIPQAAGGLRSWDGRMLMAMSGAELARDLGDVTVMIHRATLLHALSAQLPPDTVRLGARCTGLVEDRNSVTARFEDGTAESGPALIGADGLHSTVREQLFGKSPPRYAGYTSWRAVTGFDRQRLAAGISIGPGAQFGQVPMGGGMVYWFATRNLPEHSADPRVSNRSRLLDFFRDWHPPISALIEATPESAILQTDIHDRPPLKHWSKGRVTLLGDAAHPMTPNLGQGACQALEDAAVLARCLGGGIDTACALREYERRRIARANRIVLMSRRFGVVLQLENHFLNRLRDRLLANPWLARIQTRQLKWLAEFSV
jgi:2-polyprenyl-6-methoxyphenol hydroxylase-like FAD-dependent oxidoreductase